jgi:hypothetical protein
MICLGVTLTNLLNMEHRRSKWMYFRKVPPALTTCPLQYYKTYVREKTNNKTLK